MKWLFYEQYNEQFSCQIIVVGTLVLVPTEAWVGHEHILMSFPQHNMSFPQYKMSFPQLNYVVPST